MLSIGQNLRPSVLSVFWWDMVLAPVGDFAVALGECLLALARLDRFPRAPS
jgi:hypothetical protein